jgi:hypothetical protein
MLKAEIWKPYVENRSWKNDCRQIDVAQVALLAGLVSWSQSYDFWIYNYHSSISVG